MDAVLEAEAACIAKDSPFARRLAELTDVHSEWPFMASGFNPVALLQLLESDPEPATADVYWSTTRGVSLLTPAAAAAYKPTAVDNYASAAEHADRVTAEISRLRERGFLAPWSQVRSELGLPEEAQPAAILAIGAVDRNGKIRITYDGSAPRGHSVNDAMDPDPTVLPTIAYAMAAMSAAGLNWRADLEDAFLQSALAAHSIPLSCIRWDGELLAYRRLGFGFRKGPTHQQSLSLAVLRGTFRQLKRQGLYAGDVAGCDQQLPTLPHRRNHKRRRHGVSAMPCFLDDFAGFASTRAAAWYSFAVFLLTALDIGLRVSMKPGKSESPASVMLYLGFMVDSDRMIVYLDATRVEKIRASLRSFAGRDRCRIRELLSLVGVLVFCSTVIRIGRTHYRAMIDLVTRQGPHARPGSLVTLTPAVREAIDMWHRLLLTLNARSACTVISRPRVPGEATSDASFSGWGWEGMGQYGYGQWPAEWRDRIGQLLRPPRRQPRPGSSAPGLAMGTILGTGSGLGQDWVRTGPAQSTESPAQQGQAGRDRAVQIQHDAAAATSAALQGAELDDVTRRIFICELELWAVLYLVRRLAPHCVHCRLHVRVDNQPVVGMIRRLATASARCVPVLREIAWLLAAFDLELIATYITSKENLVSDVLSRAFSGDLPDGALGTVERWLQARATHGPWEQWPAETSPRPELLAAVPVARPDTYAGGLLDLSETEIDEILPEYLRDLGEAP